MSARNPQHGGTIFEPRWSDASEYGVPTGSSVTGTPVPGRTPRTPPDIRMARGEMPRPHVEN
jgi:hypothetical protein